MPGSGIDTLEAVMNTRVSIDAHPRYLIVTDVAAFAIGVFLLLLLSLIPSILSALAVVLLIAGLAMFFVLDIAFWFLKGVRSVELDEHTLTIYKGTSLESRRIERGHVSGIKVRSRLGRRDAVLILGAKERVRIAEDAFTPEAFSRFLAALDAWR
jgi:uncharacterized protein (DUF58 family)